MVSPFACFGCFPSETRLYAELAPAEAQACPRVALHASLCRGPNLLDVQKCPHALQITTIPNESVKVAICSLCPLGLVMSFRTLAANPGHLSRLGTEPRDEDKHAVHSQRPACQCQSWPALGWLSLSAGGGRRRRHALKKAQTDVTWRRARAPKFARDLGGYVLMPVGLRRPRPHQVGAKGAACSRQLAVSARK